MQRIVIHFGEHCQTKTKGKPFARRCLNDRTFAYGRTVGHTVEIDAEEGDIVCYGQAGGLNSYKLYGQVVNGELFQVPELFAMDRLKAGT